MSKVNKEKVKGDFAFGRTNYILMLAGVGLIVLGFILMSGGGTDNPNEFNEAVFSTRRITIAPIVVLAGFALEVFAIVKKAND
ncbi:MAG TPA: DUF3098 domain-containing protein [Bacteroidia bacterium]|nr:DUF3098 domain-containing protein [Bacteroidia bacterium]